jgi:lipopolysaccharide/colanic/teichoic acid biosynthesis glycosyltransferase
MNNSELSTMNSAEEAFIASKSYVYLPSCEVSPKKGSQSHPLCRDANYNNQVTGVECAQAAAGNDIRDIRTVEVRSGASKPDLGLWLLNRSGRRYDQWEGILRVSQRGARAPQFGLKYSSSLVKRVCDVIGSLFFLFLLLPLFVSVAILIKLDSPGPILFRHYRIGKDGKRFLLWKFRSMRTDVPEYEASPRSAVDSRITRIGRLLRRLSVDEMPQLMNVLKGDMSLVGPRPEMPFIVARYHSAHRERLVARPGITGLWQISPARAFPIHENLQYDLHYIRNQNLVLDCAIILRTITAVFRGVGAV